MDNYLYDRLHEIFDVDGKVNLSELETTQDKKKALFIWKKFFNDDFFDKQIQVGNESEIVEKNKPWLA